jgi:hypothetical protein
MTDFRALCTELVELLEVSEEWSGCTQPQALTRARAALAEHPVGPTLMERAMAGDAAASIVQAFADRYEINMFNVNWQEDCIAAALRAVAERNEYKPNMSDEMEVMFSEGWNSHRKELLAIADELEAQ